jgi:hypothetical protein
VSNDDELVYTEQTRNTPFLLHDARKSAPHYSPSRLSKTPRTRTVSDACSLLCVFVVRVNCRLAHCEGLLCVTMLHCITITRQPRPLSSFTPPYRVQCIVVVRYGSCVCLVRCLFVNFDSPSEKFGISVIFCVGEAGVRT